jgi:glycosyltransferase involved in cell wall biosynthesis
MNFIVVKSIDFPSGAASGQYVRLLIKGIRAAGAKACFISPFNFSRHGVEKKRQGHDDGCPYLNIASRPGGGFLSSMLLSWQGSFRLLGLLRDRKRRGRTDVILYGNGSPMHDWPMLLGCLFSRIPLFSWCVELESAPWAARSSFREKLNYWNGRWAEEWLPKITRGYIVISKRLEQFYKQRGCVVYVSPILVDPEGRTSEDRGQRSEVGASPLTPDTVPYLCPGCKVLVYSGTFEEKDGVHYLLDALQLLIKDVPDILLVMTGQALRRGGEQIMQRVHEHIERAGLQNHVKLTGFVPRAELEHINERADLFLVCRTNSRFANFGLPWKTGEYTMTGKPMVATDVSDLSYYFRDRESIFLAKPEDPHSIADTIRTALGNQELARSVGARGYQVAAAAFDYRVHGRNTVKFVEQCLGSGRQV